MTNEEIIKKIRTTGDENRDLIAELYQKNTGLIKKIAWPYVCMGMDHDDAMQEGFLALLQAVEHYEPSAGAFSTYLSYWIRATLGRALNETANAKRLPAHICGQITQYKRLCADYEKEFGCTPDDLYIRARLDITQDQLNQLRQTMQEATVFSLSEPVPGTDDLTIADVVADPADQIGDAIDDADRKEDARKIWAAVDELQDADVIKLRYQERQTMSATAQRLGVTLDRVRRTEKKGLQRLRRNKEIKLIANEYGLGTQQLYGGSLTRFKNSGCSVVEETILKLLEKRG